MLVTVSTTLTSVVEQRSVATGTSNSQTAEHSTVLFVRTENSGGVRSATTTSTPTTVLKLFVSVSVMLTRFVPRASSVPARGDWVTTNGLQSLATTLPVRSGRRAAQFVPAARAITVIVSATTGALLSITFSTMLQVAVFVPEPTTVKVMVFLPNASRVPGMGSCVILRLPPASDAITSPVKSGKRARQLVPIPTLRSGGHAVICGGAVFTTFTTCVTVALFPYPSTASQLRVAT